MALLEAAEYIHYKCLALGYRSELAINKYEANGLNIIFGAHISPANTPAFPRNTVIFNTEQLPENSAWNNQVYKNVLDNNYIWDYSPINLDLVEHKNKSLIDFHYENKLQRIDSEKEKVIDLFFYGSLNNRRVDLIKKLESTGLRIRVANNCYGIERDRILSVSKAVLNLHYYDSQIFQQIRCFYPLINGIPIFSENYPTHSAPDFFSEVIFTPGRHEFVDFIKTMISDDVVFELERRKRISIFKSLDYSIKFKTELAKTIDTLMNNCFFD